MIEITAEIIKGHGLSVDEYEGIKKLIKREPNITELGMFSVLWSEHCSYKNSKIQLKKFPTTGKHVLLGPGENAGIVDIGDGLAVSFKIESHNHPSAIEPYQGAATGAGGIIRDIFSMGARPVACLDSLRFGDIKKDKKSRHLFEYVVKGIGDYGNCVGIPTVAGEVYFEDSYQDNCLVNAMCVGVVQSTDKIISPLYGPIVKGIAKGEGNLVLYVGASTGRDGIHGATFASVELSDKSTEKKSSVQVGDPFQEKLLVEACLEILKTDCVIGMGDMGAAGLTSSLSEMATRGGHGVEIEISLVPRREEKMTPYEILLSESQERMVVIIEKGKENTAFEIFKKWGLHAVVIGKVTNDNMFRVLENGKVVAEVPATALTDDVPQYERPANKPKYLSDVNTLNLNNIKDITPINANKVLADLIAEPNIASKKWVYEQYDHMVQTGTVIPPGKGDAAVIDIKDTNKRLAVKTDGNGRYVYLNPLVGGKIAVAEAARNVACTGANPIAMTNCLNFGNPEKPESFWQFKQAVEGMAEACKVLDTPVISGNVSLYNESENGSIYPTPVVGILGLFDRKVEPMTFSFKNSGDLIYLVGSETLNEIGGSQYLKTIHGLIKGDAPEINLQTEYSLQQKTIKSIKNKWVNSVHDVSDGGLAVALIECLSFTGKGADVNVNSKEGLRNDCLLFGETQSRIVFSVDRNNQEKFEELFSGLSISCIGTVSNSNKLQMSINNEIFIDADVEILTRAYDTAIINIMKEV
ncbi:MAG: phosphoribosylformylglycinamidine synthase II [Candidatus Margulisbacteria bacterium GWF2_35_9]|nr:MAG: phosphoribosylformylglycinamidine synthase II [Candidatus Margulisbacteria bacterium GWF2_35_9]